MATAANPLPILSLIALLATNLADVVTTVRRAAPAVERTPLARRWFVATHRWEGKPAATNFVAHELAA